MGVDDQLNTACYRLLDALYFRGSRNPRRTLMDLVPQGPIRVLELCVGTALNAALIAQNRAQAQVVGIDQSESMLAIARRKLADAGLSGVQLIRMDATHTRFDDGSFDIALLSLVLHELPAQTAA